MSHVYSCTFHPPVFLCRSQFQGRFAATPPSLTFSASSQFLGEHPGSSRINSFTNCR